ncbi:hypothetical protein ALI22I_14500 [Saccharothrix sp. ALI-22-I]|nr:hypothetical protein ALI22I_14500 [Saccharothrix sp. ALI-22-I]
MTEHIPARFSGPHPDTILDVIAHATAAPAEVLRVEGAGPSNPLVVGRDARNCRCPSIACAQFT